MITFTCIYCECPTTADILFQTIEGLDICHVLVSCVECKSLICEFSCTHQELKRIGQSKNIKSLDNLTNN